jgi:hypothetical protein
VSPGEPEARVNRDSIYNKLDMMRRNY